MVNMRNPDLGEELRQLRRRIERLELSVRVPSVSLAGGGRRGVVRVDADDALEGAMIAPGIPSGTSYTTFATATVTTPAWATQVTCVALAQASGALIASGEATTLFVRARIGSEEGEPGGQGLQLTGDPQVLTGQGSASSFAAADLTAPPPTVSAVLEARHSNADANLVMNMGGVTLLAFYSDG